MKKFFITANINNLRLLQMAALLALLQASTVTTAATATANLAVSAAVSQKCTITTTPLAFGAYDPVVTHASTDLNGSGTIAVTCTKNASGLTVGMDVGTHASGAQRRMLGTGTDFLQYNLFQPPSNAPNTACTFPGATAWTNAGSGLLSLSNAPSKASRTYNVCGTIPQAQDVSVDSYTDTVITTINF